MSCLLFVDDFPDVALSVVSINTHNRPHSVREDHNVAMNVEQTRYIKRLLTHINELLLISFYMYSLD